MKLSIRTFVASGDIDESIQQMEARFGATLAEHAVGARAVAGATSIVFSPMTSHPFEAEKNVARATLHRATATYHVRAPFDYVEWANGDWVARTKTFASALTAGCMNWGQSHFLPLPRLALRPKSTLTPILQWTVEQFANEFTLP